MKHFYQTLFFFTCLFAFACNGRAQKKLAIIGSSTPACYNVILDSCYVTRVQQYYSNAGTPVTIDNKAQAGDGCYRGMPSTYTPPPGRNAPEPARNITAVLAGNPDVVLVHYPSNSYDVISIAEAMFCFRTIKQAANNAGKPCYIGTTQPRTSGLYNTPEIKKKMVDLKDSILNAFGPYAVNFWDGLVNPADTSLLPQYDSGDSTHLTAAGHGVIAGRVIQKNLFSGVLPVSFTSFSAYTANHETYIQWTAAAEQEVSSYNIERSDDGTVFRTIRQVVPRLLSQQNNYSVTDPAPAGNYYRVAAINKSGQPSYTRVIRVEGNGTSFRLQRIVVNGPAVSAELHAAEKQAVTLQLVNNQGQVLSHLSSMLQAGFNTIKLPASIPVSGLYFLRIFNSRLESQVKAFEAGR